MADAVQQLWTGTVDVEEPELPRAITVAVVTIGAALPPAADAPTDDSKLRARLVDLRSSVDELLRNRNAPAVERTLALGQTLAGSFAWRSDVELARSNKFWEVLDRPEFLPALLAARVSDEAAADTEIVVRELVGTDFPTAQERFSGPRRTDVRSEVATEIDFSDVLMHSADAEPGLLDVNEVTTAVTTDALRIRRPSVPTDHRITVYFGTDRAGASGTDFFDGRRDPNDAMHYGIATIDVPESHRIGRRRRLSIGWRKLSWSGAPRLTSVIPLSLASFDAEIDREIAALGANERRIVVFVHGFRTSFRNAMVTTGQLAADLGIAGVTAAFSWPSANKLHEYRRDRAEARSSADHLVDFIVDLTQRTGVESVDVIFHSMGNYLFANAASALVGALAAVGRRLGAVVLAAPDVTPSEFSSVAGLRPMLSSYGTMYATKRDLALGLSGAVRRSQRAGTLPPVVTHRHVDTVDATLVNESFIGHAYHVGSRAVIADIFHAIQGDSPTARFGLSPQTSPPHWRIKG
ncbi:alpha/beta hydrolase [Curtobacterium sp. 22159]|uniref:alpha/beta hydrolase n=1 Tax=Curtobacterium sp. 22159 TaxID=3453882 RepID=UPI003F869A26